PLAALLPRLNEPASAGVVDNRGAGARERQSPATALHATPDRPGAGRATASAERRREADQSVAAPDAERGARKLAGGATVRQEDLQQHTSTLGRDPSRER